MKMILNGESEGAMTFNPKDKANVAHVIKMAKVRAKKILSPERKATLAATLSKARAARQRIPA